MLDIHSMLLMVPALARGAMLTLHLTGLSLVIGFFLAIPLAMALLNQGIIRRLAQGYVFFFRGTPLLIQIFLIYYGPSQFEFIQNSFLWPLLRQPFACGVIALSLNTAAYTAEIMRGAFQAIPAGDIEAGRAFGMSRRVILSRIMIPHAMRLGLGAYGNEIILLLKGSALVSAITLMDLTGVAQQIYARSYRPFEPLITAGILYLLMTLAISFVIDRLQRHYRPVGRNV